ncbi:hypothetical protein ANAPH2_00334 [Anaplasma phagocytophilum]|nr:hypothetical protein ANAPH2_00334 [Anaplasma phagocytophilum]
MMTTGFLLASPLVRAFCYTITRVIGMLSLLGYSIYSISRLFREHGVLLTLVLLLGEVLSMCFL